MPVPIFDEALAAQLLQTDACIIAEDGENVVVAVRLPKATIAGADAIPGRAGGPYLVTLSGGGLRGSRRFHCGEGIGYSQETSKLNDINGGGGKFSATMVDEARAAA